MPTIRDGNNRVSSYDMGVPPPASPSGPVERSQVSAARMADFAAERAAAAAKAERAAATMAESRARGAKAGGFVKGATKPLPKPRSVKEVQIADAIAARAASDDEARAAAETEAWVAEQAAAKPPPPRSRTYPVDRQARNTAKRLERAGRILAAIRTTSSHQGAATALGMSRHAVEMFVSDLRRRGELPADVEALLRARNPNNAAAYKAKAAGIIPAHSSGNNPAPDSTLAPESEWMATAAGATPPDPIDASKMHETHPDLTTPGRGRGGPVEGEDRCSFGRWIDGSTIVICDRATGHEGGHRGRLVRALFLSQTYTILGHAAVPA